MIISAPRLVSLCHYNILLHYTTLYITTLLHYTLLILKYLFDIINDIFVMFQFFSKMINSASKKFCCPSRRQHMLMLRQGDRLYIKQDKNYKSE